jgi:hypothetical protein
VPGSVHSRPRKDTARQLCLFAGDVLRSRPALESRLLRLAKIPARRATEKERREDEARETMDRLRSWGRDLARHFRLRGFSLEPERDGITEHYGVCYVDGLIRIRLRHATTGRILKESSLVDTLCHELAHLRHFDHSPRFWRTYRAILQEARKRGIYRPGPETIRPRQGSLFELAEGVCGTRSRRRSEIR